jgi:hypothetical protein
VRDNSFLVHGFIHLCADAAALLRVRAGADDKKMCCAPKCAKKGKITTAGILRRNQRFILIRARLKNIPAAAAEREGAVFLLLFSGPYECTEVEAILSRAYFTQNAIIQALLLLSRRENGQNAHC